MTPRVKLRSQLPLVSDDSARAWVEFAFTGKWEGYHGGPFEFKRSDLENMVNVFNSKANQNALPLKYEHPDAHGQPIPAAGWIHALELRGNSLWGYCEFTKRAEEFIRAGEYRFCSVEVDMHAIDRETAKELGPRLAAVGLTNEPFLDNQSPIRLSATVAISRAKDPPAETVIARVCLKAITPQTVSFGANKIKVPSGSK